MMVKICGLKTLELLHAASAAGADMVGLVFAPSKRQVSVAQAQALVAEFRGSAVRQPQIVGLFVNETAAAVAEIAAAVGLDALQLSGDEPVDLLESLPLPVIKAIRLDGSPAEAAWIAAARAEQVRLLVDAHVAGAYGGTGTRADWAQAAQLAAEVPIMLAGGLHPENVREAIAHVRPWGVDVSSGVEVDGVKDAARIAAFVAATRH